MRDAPQLPLTVGGLGDLTAERNANWLLDQLGPCLTRYMDRERVDASGWRGQPLSQEEVADLRRAVTEGFVVVDDDEAVLVVDKFYTSKRYRLFQSYDGGVTRPGRAWSWSWRECFSQLAFACELVVDHGWPSAQVALEVGAMDLAAGKDPVAAPVLMGEAKVKALGQSGLDGMLAVFDELAGGPQATVGAAVRLNASRKYEDLLRIKPMVFVAIAPGVRQLFNVVYESGPAVLSVRTAGVAPADMTP